MKIGFIGLGIMGSRMAANLQAAGHELVLYNRTAAKATPLVNKGAILKDSPSAVAEEVEMIITMLAHPSAVRTVALGTAGFLASLKAGAVWMDCSTVNPSFSKEMAQVANQRQVAFLDAPVAGSKNQAAAAQLVFFLGGEEKVVDKVTTLTAVMGKKSIHVGGNGMGSALKIVVNQQLATSMIAFGEGMALGESLGLSQSLLFDVLLGGPVVPPYLSFKRAKMEKEDYDVEFPLRWIQKDLQMASQTAYETGVAMPLTGISKDCYQMAMNAGRGELDFSSMYSFLKKPS